jgi:HEAT repeat protein
MSALPPAADRQALMMELRRCAGGEDLPGAIAAAERLAALLDDEVPEALASELASLDAVDLSEDSGDGADELWRKRAALQAALVRCGSRVLACVRPMTEGTGQAAQVALRVLAELRDQAALPVARRWVRDDAPQAHSARLAAIDALGWLQPPDAASLLREAIARPDPINGSWTKRMAAHALGRLGDVVGLDSLLDDPDWFARLGAAEALAKLPPGQGEAARQRALHDCDGRVAQAARRQ